MRVFIAILIILLSTQNAYADSGSIKLEDFTYNDFFCPQVNKIFFIQHDVELKKSMLKIFDPFELEVEKVILLDDYTDQVDLIQDGKCMLVLGNKIYERSHVENGTLRKVDFVTGEIQAEIVFDRYPRNMVIDNNRKFAFVTGGLNGSGMLYKIDLEKFEVVADIILKDPPEMLAITPDGKKLYVRDESSITIPSPSGVERSSGGYGYSGTQQMFFPLTVYDTQDLSRISAVMTPIYSEKYFIIDDGRLILPGFCLELSPNPNMMVVDTNVVDTNVADTHNEEILEILDFGDIMIGYTAIDNRHLKLFATIGQRAGFDPEYPEFPHYELSGTILEVNLKDYSHRLIKICDSKVGQIIAIPTDTGTRLFCIDEPETPDDEIFLHYFDVE